MALVANNVYVVMRVGRAVAGFLTWAEANEWRHADGRNGLDYTLDCVPLWINENRPPKKKDDQPSGDKL